MIKEISVSVYRKLKDIKLQFSPCVNIISGVNGTCKSSLLHIISNSFQALKQKSDSVSDSACVRVISKVNSLVNPKIEALTPHELRHAYAKMLYENNVNVATAQELLGHAQYSTTMDIYTTLREKQMEKERNAILSVDIQ